MKKIIIFLFIITIILLINDNKKYIFIPNESIRFRIIANSNSNKDQELKKEIKNKLENELYYILKDSNNINDARNNINNNIDYLDNLLKKYNINYSISYGNNYFPKKEYKNILYKEGNYESLVITIGEGLGDNYWCCLFPPLCFIDEDISNYEYSFYVNKLINKY